MSVIDYFFPPLSNLPLHRTVACFISGRAS